MGDLLNWISQTEPYLKWHQKGVEKYCTRLFEKLQLIWYGQKIKEDKNYRKKCSYLRAQMKMKHLILKAIGKVRRFCVTKEDNFRYSVSPLLSNFSSINAQCVMFKMAKTGVENISSRISRQSAKYSSVFLNDIWAWLMTWPWIPSLLSYQFEKYENFKLGTIAAKKEYFSKEFS